RRLSATRKHAATEYVSQDHQLLSHRRSGPALWHPAQRNGARVHVARTMVAIVGERLLSSTTCSRRGRHTVDALLVLCGADVFEHLRTKFTGWTTARDRARCARAQSVTVVPTVM